MSGALSPAAYAKALVAAVVAGVAPAAAQAVTDGHVTGSTGIASAVTALVGGIATYVTKNGGSGLVVELRTDAARFLAEMAKGLPQLVDQAARAALQPGAAPPPAAGSVQGEVSAVATSSADDLMWQLAARLGNGTAHAGAETGPVPAPAAGPTQGSTAAPDAVTAPSVTPTVASSAPPGTP